MFLLPFGHPFSGTLLIGRSMFSLRANDDVPLAMKMSRGSDEARSRGTNVCVMTCVPTTLTFQVVVQA